MAPRRDLALKAAVLLAAIALLASGASAARGPARKAAPLNTRARAAEQDDSAPFDLEYGKYIVDFNTAVYCPDRRVVETWTRPVCNKTRIKNFEVDAVIHEFELNINAYTGYSPTLGKPEAASHAAPGSSTPLVDNITSPSLPRLGHQN